MTISLPGGCEPKPLPRAPPCAAAPPQAAHADHDDRGDPGPGTELVLADRAKIVQHRIGQAYPQTRKSRMTYSGSGYSDGYAQGQRADLDGARLAAKRSRALGSGDR